jgi:hypothetical protein
VNMRAPQTSHKVPASDLLVVHIARYSYNQVTKQTSVDCREVIVPKQVQLPVSLAGEVAWALQITSMPSF